MRAGADYFLRPAGASQRRYEALRAYFVEGMPASDVAARFGYTAGSVHQMATLLRAGKLALFSNARPGPKGPRKATSALRARVLALRGAGQSITEIAAGLTAEGLPLSAQSVWQILDAAGISRLRHRGAPDRGTAGGLAAPAARLPTWPTAPLVLPCDHAGLLLLVPGMAELGLHDLVRAASYPATAAFSAWQAFGAMLFAKCGRWARSHHLGALLRDAGLAFAVGLTTLPSATDMDTYSRRVHREPNQELLTRLIQALRRLGLATGETGFNCDFRHVRRSRGPAVVRGPASGCASGDTGTRSAFLAWDHASSELVYANADLTRAEQTREIIAFAQYWKEAAGTEPGLLVFDSRLTTYKVLEELSARGIRWLSVRQRGQAELARLAALPGDAWQGCSLAGAGFDRLLALHEDMITLQWMTSKTRQIAISDIGCDKPILLITNDPVTPAEDLVARYAESQAASEQSGANGFRLDAATAGMPFNIDLDTTLTVIADSLYRLLARRIPRHEAAAPSRLWRQFLDTSGTLRVTRESVTCHLNLRSHHPVLVEAGFADLEIPVPWWEGRTLRYRFATTAQ